MDITATNMSDDMATLSDAIEQATGITLDDTEHGPAFLASETDACSKCEQVRATVVVGLGWDESTMARVCEPCFRDELYGQ